MQEITTVVEAVGANVRRLRAELRLSQDDVATAASTLGMDWRQSSVAQLESGTRQLTANELLLLPAVLRVAQAKWPDREALQVTLADLLDPGKAAIALSSMQLVQRAAVHSWLGGEPPPVADEVLEHPWRRIDELTRSVAPKLSVPPGIVHATCLELWGRNLSTERDRRMRERGFDLLPARSMQARRGHITRELLIELEDAVSYQVWRELHQEEPEGGWPWRQRTYR